MAIAGTVIDTVKCVCKSTSKDQKMNEEAKTKIICSESQTTHKIKHGF